MRFELGTRQLDRKYTVGKTVVRSTSTTRQRKTLNIKSTEQQGREAWDAIHSYLGCSREWFEKTWEPMIPNLGCACMRDYREYKTKNPPDFSSPDALFIWGVDLHNWVNRKLHRNGDTTKRIVTIDEARAIWGRA